MSAIIQTNQLTKSYGKSRGIIDVTFDIQEGEVFGFLGPNGAGKTTTMRTLMGLLRANSGPPTARSSVRIRALIVGWAMRIAPRGCT